MNIREMLERRSMTVAAMRTILDKAEVEKRDLSAEEVAAFDKLKAEAAKVETAIQRQQAVDDIERRAAGTVVHAGQATGETPERRAGGIYQAIARRSIPGAAPVEARAGSGQVEALGSEGGFFVNSDLNLTLAAKMAEQSQLLPLVQRVQISAGSGAVQLPVVDESSRADGLRNGGAMASWLGEGDQIASSKVKFRQLNVTLGKLASLYYCTDELLEDAPALGTLLNNFFAGEFGFSIDAAILNGTGTQYQPSGILHSPALVTAAKESTQTGKTLLYQNILAMWSRMWSRGRANAVWLVGPGVEPQLYQMSLTVGDGGAPVFLPGGGASASPYASLFGRPIIPMEQLPALGSKGDIVLADLSQYVWIDKAGVQNASSIGVRFEYAETAFRSIYRANGMPTWSAPLAPYSGTDTVSPFVCLEDRAA